MVKPRQVIAALGKIGFVEHHQKGSHLFLWNPQTRRMVTVPQHPGDLKLGTLKAIIKQAGLADDDFRRLL